MAANDGHLNVSSGINRLATDTGTEKPQPGVGHPRVRALLPI